MRELTNEICAQYDALFEKKKNKILNSADNISVKGTTYYVSNTGDDKNDGKSPDKSWKTLKRVTDAYLYPSDAVLFKRGDLFRGQVIAKAGVTYAAYGVGDKPKFYACDFSLADPDLWELYDEKCHIWKLKKPVPDAGSVVFNDGEFHSRKLIPSYKNLTFVCRNDESKAFDMRTEMTEDLDIYWYYEEYLSQQVYNGENFPVPYLRDGSIGSLYLRCDRGNPGDVFNSVEALASVKVFSVPRKCPNVTIDNLCIKYTGQFAVCAGGHVKGLSVTNCEMGWIGGAIQHYFGTDPNYTEGKRGSVTRYGNAVEIYGGCENYVVSNNYIYEVYDAGITHQISTSSKVEMKNIRYCGNVIEKCVYGIEYFLDQINGETESLMSDVLMEDNFIRLSGYGWGQQRHNKHTPAHIKGWQYTNTAENFNVSNNIFDRCAYSMIQLVAEKQESVPKLNGNTYIQHIGKDLGQVGCNENGNPPTEVFNETANSVIKNIFGDKKAMIYYIK